MEWLFPILCWLGVGLALCFFGWIANERVGNTVDGIMLVVFLIWAVSFIVVCVYAPVNYCCDSRNDALEAQAYWESIQPCIVSWGDGYVLVHSTAAGVWQAGDYNVTAYNQYIKVTEHWRSVPFIKWFVYPVPEELVPVRIVGGE